MNSSLHSSNYDTDWSVNIMKMPQIILYITFFFLKNHGGQLKSHAEEQRAHGKYAKYDGSIWVKQQTKNSKDEGLKTA